MAAAPAAAPDPCEHGCLGGDLPVELEWMILDTLSLSEIISVARTSKCCKFISDGAILAGLREAIHKVALPSRSLLYYMFMKWPRDDVGHVVTNDTGRDPVLGWHIRPGASGNLDLLRHLVREVVADDVFLHGRVIEQNDISPYIVPEEPIRGHPAGKYRWFYDSGSMGRPWTMLVLGGGVGAAMPVDERDTRIPNAAILAACRSFNGYGPKSISLYLQSCQSTTIPAMVRLVPFDSDARALVKPDSLDIGNWPNLPRDAQIFKREAAAALCVSDITLRGEDYLDVLLRVTLHDSDDEEGPSAIESGNSWRGNGVRQPVQAIRIVNGMWRGNDARQPVRALRIVARY
jgi:hypothetical protein